MNIAKKPCGINHQQSYFLPSEKSLMSIEVDLDTNKKFHWYTNPLTMHDVYDEGNMDNIFETIPINIYSNPNIVENVFIGVDCTPKEIEIYTALFK